MTSSLFGAFCAAFVLLTLLIAAPRTADAKYAALVMDVESGEVLFSRNADTRRYPASLTKIMTLYLLFEALEKKKVTLNTKLKVSKRAAGQPASKLGLRRGKTIRVEDAIKALVVKSANDVATVVAEGLAGSEIAFARRMTEKAKALGMKRTQFRNASGLPNRRQLSTARDMAKLGLAIQKDFPQYYAYFRTSRFKWGGRTYRSHNRLLGNYKGTDGVKTGYIRASGFNLVSSVKRPEAHLIGVVFGGKSSRSRDRHMVKILTKGFKTARTRYAFRLNRNAPPLPLPRPTQLAKAEGTTPSLISAAQASTRTPAPPPPPAPPAHASLDRAAIQAAPSSKPKKTSVWGIQVGAYTSAKPAQRILRTVREHIPDLPEDATDSVQSVRKEAGTIFRARIIGLDEIAARTACAELVARHLPCVAVPNATGLELAEVGEG